MTSGQWVSQQSAACGGDAWRNSFSVAATIGKRELHFGFQSAYVSLVTRRQLFPFRVARCAKAKVLHHKRVVVLLFAFFIRPVVGTDLRLHDELVTLARILGDSLAETLERDEPQTGDGLADVPEFVLACIIVAHQTQARISGIAFNR